jgi:membrane fusion protein (multidrug efflux system)
MDLQGARQIAVVDGSNKVAIRTVTLGDTAGVDWIVREGAKPGERVVVEGLQKVRQGMLVDPQPDRHP